MLIYKLFEPINREFEKNKVAKGDKIGYNNNNKILKFILTRVNALVFKWYKKGINLNKDNSCTTRLFAHKLNKTK